MDVRKDSQRYDLHDLYFECADETIEAAAAELKYKAGSQTISFCSGIDTCPSRPESPVPSG